MKFLYPKKNCCLVSEAREKCTCDFCTEMRKNSEMGLRAIYKWEAYKIWRSQFDEDKNKEIAGIKTFGILNEVDWAMIYFLGHESQSVGDLQKKLKIAPVNVWKHLTKLNELEIVKMPDVSRGKKKIVELKNKELFDLAQVVASAKKKITDKILENPEVKNE
jgi:DNA-binding transcriptional ArsR family regulator